MWGFGLAVFWDLGYRTTHRPELAWLRYFWPTAGGMFYYVPVWILFGAGPIGYSLVSLAHQNARPRLTSPAPPRAPATPATFPVPVRPAVPPGPDAPQKVRPVPTSQVGAAVAPAPAIATPPGRDPAGEGPGARWPAQGGGASIG